jgi:hypothetical protein
MFSKLNKSHRLSDNVENFSGDRGATNDVTISRIRVACWISNAICTQAHAHAPGYPHTRTHAQACTHRPICNTYCFFTATIGIVNAPQCYVTRTLPVLLHIFTQYEIINCRVFENAGGRKK